MPFRCRRLNAFIYCNFITNRMPLDAAIRQLGNEQDDTSYYFAPQLNSDGSYTIIPDAAHTLNGTPQSTSGGVTSNFGGQSPAKKAAPFGLPNPEAMS